MANKFEKITQYIPQLETEDFGEWIIDKENDGTPEHPVQLPFVDYSSAVHQFQNDLFSFCDEHPEYEYTKYGSTLEASGLEWGSDSMNEADVSELDAKTIIAMLVGACRAERFCDGALLDFLESGAILRWLKRLRELGENCD